MIEITKPMSKGRAPTSVGVVSIVADGGIYPVDITNREISFPNYPVFQWLDFHDLVLWPIKGFTRYLLSPNRRRSINNSVLIQHFL